MSLTLVGVYGSLRQGFGNHSLIGQEPLATKRIQLPFYMVSLGAFPALCPSATDNSIVIELYEVDAATFTDLDYLEGYPEFYNRTQFSVDYGTGKGLAWIYHFTGASPYGYHEIVESGDWRQYCDKLMGV